MISFACHKTLMERNSLSSSLRDHSIRDCNTTTTNISTSTSNKMMLKDSWTCSNTTQEDYISGFSWPPRCYTCSFCKREFRSAQALGGHMNVHRRDRARLRQSPPPPTPPPNSHGQYTAILNLNLNPNPNPNYSNSSSPSMFTTSLPSLVSPPISALSSPSSASPPAQPSELKKWVVDSASFLDPSSPKSDESCKFFKTTALAHHVDHSVKLDLEIGQVSESKEDLDLELRLGSYC